mgnify:CR=1 FL=1
MAAASSCTIHGYTLTRVPKHTERGYNMALISIKDVKQAIRLMMDILEKLDEIYHALHDSINEKEKE